MQQTKKVVISGAGVAGLTTAWHLASQGWQVTVLEKAAELRTGGYLMSLSGPGYNVAKKMGITEALRAYHSPIEDSVCYGKNDKELWRISYPTALQDVEWVTLLRTDLVRVLYEKVKDMVDIRFDRTVSEHTSEADRVKVTVSDGTQLEADLFLAAEGIRSPTRQKIFTSEKATLHMGYRFGAFLIPNTLQLGSDFMSFAEPGRVSEFYTRSESEVATLFVWRSNDCSPIHEDGALAILQDAYKDAHPAVLNALDQMTDSSSLYADNLEMVKLPKWHSGRCVLLGDAAHCLSLVSSQGAGMAMTSAWLLSEMLAKHNNIDEAIKEHSDTLMPVIQGMQAKTLKIAKAYIPLSPLGFSIRNGIFKRLPARFLGRYISRSLHKEAAKISSELNGDFM